MNFGHLVTNERSAPTAVSAVASIGLLWAIMESKKRLVWALPALGIEMFAKLWAWHNFRHRMFSKYSRWVTVKKGIPTHRDAES